MEKRAVESVEHKVDSDWYEEVCRETQKNKENIKQWETERFKERAIRKILCDSRIGYNSCTVFPSLYPEADREVLEEFKAAGFKVESTNNDNCFYYIVSWGEE